MTNHFDWESCRTQIAAFLGKTPDCISRETHIYNDIGLDSLGIFSLGMHLIAQFKIHFPLSEVATIATAGDIYDALERYRDTAVKGASGA